jgi:glycerophosphoryl diester phosphodiesterase
MTPSGPRPSTVTPHPFRIYGHRGAPAEVPENTLASFARALELGCDALETDVHLTRDGQLLVHHDATATRLSRDPRRIADLHLDEARRLDVGRGLHPPTLDEVLDAFPGIHVNIDIKAHTRAAARATVACVARRGDAHRVLLTSVDDGVIREVRAAGHGGDVGVGKSGALAVLCTPARLLGAAGRLGWIDRQALQIPWRFKGLRFDRPWVLGRGHAAGLRIDYWTINDPAIARSIVALGADGIMTDDPARVVAAIGEARETLHRRPRATWP